MTCSALIDRPCSSITTGLVIRVYQGVQLTGSLSQGNGGLPGRMTLFGRRHEAVVIVGWIWRDSTLDERIAILQAKTPSVR